MDVRVGLQRKLNTEELMLSNCSVGEDSRESLGLLRDQRVNPKGPVLLVTTCTMADVLVRSDPGCDLGPAS